MTKVGSFKPPNLSELPIPGIYIYTRCTNGSWATVGERRRGGRHVHRLRKSKRPGLRVMALNAGTKTGKARVMGLQLEIEGVMFSVVGDYAPQLVSKFEEREKFWSEVDKVMQSIPRDSDWCRLQWTCWRRVYPGTQGDL